jgi:predicted nucleic acid-binding protein
MGKGRASWSNFAFSFRTALSVPSERTSMASDASYASPPQSSGTSSVRYHRVALPRSRGYRGQSSSTRSLATPCHLSSSPLTKWWRKRCVPDAPRVVDASPLIVLARIGRLELLGTAIVLPAAVVAEVLVGPEDDAARRAIESGRFPPGEFVEVPSVIVEWGLGAGESAVLALTRSRPGSEAVLDDGQGRRCARALGIPVIGTLGLVVRAARQGVIPTAAPVVGELRAAGLRLDDHLVADVLRRALGEEWVR